MKSLVGASNDDIVVNNHDSPRMAPDNYAIMKVRAEE